ncbi:MAG: Mitochondrial inner membrane protease atp23 [Icmadophila ericetorum]|nr:Mitochondrial inner membrane protease atp23 [Icmadophila ericetorum]
MADTTPPTATPVESKETGYYPGKDSWSRWRNWFSLVSGSMTDEGREQYREARNLRWEEVDCKKCEKDRDYLLQYSTFCLPARRTVGLGAQVNSVVELTGPIILFMREKMNQMGGDVHNGNIRCRRCPTRQSGGFDPEFGILICANEIRNRGHLEDTMAHEMVHAYDHLRFKVDWYNDLRHAACTEIRASSLSGECRWSREFFTRNQWNLTQQHQECVRRRATLSVSGRPICKNQTQAAKVVNEVWDSCFADTRPFDEIYR